MKLDRFVFIAAILFSSAASTACTENGKDDSKPSNTDGVNSDAGTIADADGNVNAFGDAETDFHEEMDATFDAQGNTGADVGMDARRDTSTDVEMDVIGDADPNVGLDATSDSNEEPDSIIDADKDAPPNWYLTIETPLEEMGKESFVPCELAVNEVEYADCEVRLSGESSLNFPKKSFRIKFPEDAPHPGFTRKIILRAEWNDPSFMRNIIGHSLFRNLTDIPTPQTRFVRLFLNDEYYGLMLEVERIGGHFLEENKRDRESSMYEADPPITPVSYVEMGAAAFINLSGETDVTYQMAYQKHTAGPEDPDETDYSDLIVLIEDTVESDFSESSTSRIQNGVNMEAYLEYLAVMALLANQDHVRKNYYFSYQNEKWEFYPVDLDLTFGCIYNVDEMNTICQLDNIKHDIYYFPGMYDEDLIPFYGDQRYYNLLIHTVLWDEIYWSILETNICTFLDYNYWKDGIFEEIDAIETLISDSVAEDPNDRNETIEEFHTWVETLRTFIDEREAYLRGEINCPPGSPRIIPATIRVYSDKGFIPGTALWQWKGGTARFEDLLNCPDAPEGDRCFTSEGSSWTGWGVFTAIGQNQTLDLSSCDELVFDLWVDRSDISLKIEIQIESATGPKYTYRPSEHSANSWQEIIIPVNEFGSADLSQVFGVFMATSETGGAKFMVDNIRWNGCNS